MKPAERLALWETHDRPDGWNSGNEHHLADLIIRDLRGDTPADDVREALARTLWEAAVRDNPEGVPGESWEELIADEPAWAEGYYAQADAALAVFEVRPYGTVTDAENLHRVALYNSDGSPRSLDEIRAEGMRKAAALNAAQEADQ